MILKMQMQSLPWFRFEWHPEEKKVYVIRIPTEISALVAQDVTSQEQAHIAIEAFVSGYGIKATEPKIYRGDNPRTYVLKAETINFKVL
jgi:hypothetical protein